MRGTASPSPERPIALDGGKYHLRLESRRVVPARSSLHSLLLIRRLKRARSQAETRPIALCRFPGPVLTDVHLGRWYLTGAAGDAANVGHNLRLVLAWLRLLLRLLLIALARLFAIPIALNPAS
jgi:transposase, IS5 family